MGTMKSYMVDDEGHISNKTHCLVCQDMNALIIQ